MKNTEFQELNHAVSEYVCDVAIKYGNMFGDIVQKTSHTVALKAEEDFMVDNQLTEEEF